jgi:hypothetical protein
VPTAIILTTHIHKNVVFSEFQSAIVRLYTQPTSMKNAPLSQSINGLSPGCEAGIRLLAESGISFRPCVQQISSVSLGSIIDTKITNWKGRKSVRE